MIDAYFDSLEDGLQSLPMVISYEAIRAYPSPNTGYIRGKVLFVDHSTLHFFEFVRKIYDNIERDKYRYQYLDKDKANIFRYDNAPHHKFSYHKHLKGGETIESPPLTLKQVLQEIINLIIPRIK